MNTSEKLASQMLAAMDGETLEKAAVSFFTTEGIGKGAGLALPMVHGLMAQSWGALTLESRKGEGTTAQLWLPIATAVDEPVSAAAREPAAPEPVASTLTRPLTVLAVGPWSPGAGGPFR